MPPAAYKINQAKVTFLFPNLLARGHTAKIPIPIGSPPITEIIVCVNPSL